MAKPKKKKKKKKSKKQKVTEIHIGSCGGTIEGEQDAAADTVTMSSHSNVMKYLRQVVRPSRSVRVSYKIFTLVDSREITRTLRQAIAEYLLNCPHQRIVVPIGTYRMVWVAKYVKKMMKKLGIKKTVIFTGGFIPLSTSNNDSSYSLGCAMTAARLKGPGVWICMNAEIFDPDKVSKDIYRAEFVNRARD